MRRLFDGGRTLCVETLTNFISKILKVNVHWDMDGNGTPFCRLHYQMCLPGGFCTPWQYISQNVIDGSVIEHLNNSRPTLAVPVFCVSREQEGLENGFGLLNFRCSPATGDSRRAVSPVGLTPFLKEYYAFSGTNKDGVECKSEGAGLDDVGHAQTARLVYTGVVPGLGTFRWNYVKVAECDRALQDYDDQHDATFFHP